MFGANLRYILIAALVTPVLSSSSNVHAVRFLETPPTSAPPPAVFLRDNSGEVSRDTSPDALRSAQQTAATTSFSENDVEPGNRQLRLLGSATAALSAAQQPALEDPVRAFYRGLADQPAGSDAPAPAQVPQVPQDAQVQPPLPTLSPWGMSGTVAPPPVPLGGLPSMPSGRTSSGTDVKAKMGELNTAVNNVLSELTQQLEQQQRFAMDKEEALEKEQAQVSTLTQENMQLGAQVAQLQASRVGMVEDAKSLSDDVQSRLATWIAKYESRAVGQAQGQATTVQL